MIDDIVSILDAPGAFLRNSLAGRNPLQGITTDEDRTSGRDLLEAWGLLDPNEEGLDWGDVAGFGVDVLADPLNLLGGFGAWKGAKWLSKARQAGDALPVAAQAVDPVADVVETLGRRQLHPYQTMRPDNYQVAPPASEILDRLPASQPKPVAPPEYEMQPYPVEGFYSRLEEAAKALPNTAKGIKAESLRNLLQKAPEGFSAEEWKLYGMDDLVSRGGRIGKDEILHHMAMNRPGLGFKGLHKAQDFSGPDYSQYSPPGFLEGSYVEEGLALPDLRPDIMRGNILDDVYAFQRGSLPRQAIAERLRILRQNPESREQLRRASLGQQYSRWPIGEDVPAPVRTATANAAMYPDSFYISPDFSNHAFQEKNVIGWRRAATHTNPQGEKVHVAYEFQSDAHQANVTNPRYGSKVAPLKKEWTAPLIRRHIQDAVNQQADRVGFITGDTAAQFTGGQLSGQRAFYGAADTAYASAEEAVSKLLEEIRAMAPDNPKHAFLAKKLEGWIKSGMPLSHEDSYKGFEVLEALSRDRDAPGEMASILKSLLPEAGELRDVMRNAREWLKDARRNLGVAKRTHFGYGTREAIQKSQQEFDKAKAIHDALNEWERAGHPVAWKNMESVRKALTELGEKSSAATNIAERLFPSAASKSAKIPTAVEKYLKQRGWDTNLERDFIVGPTGEQYPIFSFKITDKMREDLAKRGQPLFSVGLPLGLGLGVGALAADPLGMGEGV